MVGLHVLSQAITHRANTVEWQRNCHDDDQWAFNVHVEKWGGRCIRKGDGVRCAMLTWMAPRLFRHRRAAHAEQQGRATCSAVPSCVA